MVHACATNSVTLSLAEGLETGLAPGGTTRSCSSWLFPLSAAAVDNGAAAGATIGNRQRFDGRLAANFPGSWQNRRTAPLPLRRFSPCILENWATPRNPIAWWGNVLLN